MVSYSASNESSAAGKGGMERRIGPPFRMKNVFWTNSATTPTFKNSNKPKMQSLMNENTREKKYFGRFEPTSSFKRKFRWCGTKKNSQLDGCRVHQRKKPTRVNYFIDVCIFSDAMKMSSQNQKRHFQPDRPQKKRRNVRSTDRPVFFMLKESVHDRVSIPWWKEGRKPSFRDRVFFGPSGRTQTVKLLTTTTTTTTTTTDPPPAKNSLLLLPINSLLGPSQSPSLSLSPSFLYTALCCCHWPALSSVFLTRKEDGTEVFF